MIAESVQKLADIEQPGNPFPGLRPFEFYESYLFFGRDGQSEQLIARLSRTRFLAVVGTSGSGKSSLVRAGLLPALLGGLMATVGSRWRMAIMRPGNDPIANLADALNAPDAFGSQNHTQAPEQLAITEAVLRRGSLGLVEAVRQAKLPPGEQLLVLVDQFEELFRVEQDVNRHEAENDKAAFVKLLLAATHQQELPIYVVLTMRSDYLGDCAQFWDLPEAINDGQYLIPRLTREQRREAITGPVAVGSGVIAPRLVNRLLNDVGDDPDQLPILQHTLMRTWDNWQGNQGANESLDLRHYEAIGGLTAALSRHADEAYQELSAAGQKLAEKLFKCLTEKGPDNREIRRPLTVRDLCAVTAADEEEVITVIEAFRRPGRSFLMPPAEVALTADSLIDISHESLIRNWQRLKDWVEEEAQSAATYKRLAETAVRYEKGEEGLLRDPALQLAVNWRDKEQPNAAWAQRYHSEFVEVMDFLDDSVARRDEEAREQEAQRQCTLKQAQALAAEQERRAEAEQQRAEEQARASRRFRWLSGGLFVMFLIAVGALVFAWQQKQLAQSGEIQAQTALATASRVDESSTTNVPSSSGRIYMQIRPDQPREKAREIQRKLKERHFDVPGIERLDVGPTTNTEVRYFQNIQNSGEDTAKEIVGILQSLDVKNVKPIYIPGYENSTKIRPKHFEIWFAPNAFK